MSDDYRYCDVPCPACFAPSGKPCTRPTDSSRVPVAWVHYARQHASEDRKTQQ